MARVILYILRGRPRSLAHDALYAIADMPVPPLVRGADRIPPSGRLAVTANHYERPGLWMAWPALFLAHVIQEHAGRNIHFVAIETWERLALAGIEIPRELIRAGFERAFSVYGILPMAAPDAPVAARAASLRLATATIRHDEIIGLMPEGTVGATPELLTPPEGVGTFLTLLRAPILPVGLFEEGGRLVAHIGAPRALHPPANMARDERDAWVRREVMEAIRDLLPESLWGAYR